MGGPGFSQKAISISKACRYAKGRQTLIRHSILSCTQAKKPILCLGGVVILKSRTYEDHSTVESRFKKARFKKESGFKKDCWYNRFLVL